MPVLLSWLSILCLLLNYIKFNSKKTAIGIVKDMGIGYNLGNTYNCCFISEGDDLKNQQIKLWGTVFPTKKIIGKIKKFGFKTIRFQVKYTEEINNSENYLNWISKIKEIIQWVINKNMYFILSIYHEMEFWEAEKENGLDKYINIWKEISNELKHFDEHLIFESSNNIDKMENLKNASQSFIDVIRSSRGYNKNRLLIIPQFYTELELTYFNEIDLPEDKENKIAFSLHFFFPSYIIYPEDYDYESYLTLKTYFDYVYKLLPIKDWGLTFDYKEMVYQFQILKELYIDKGIPIIIGEAGIITKYNNDLALAREFLYVFFSLLYNSDGIMACLWDRAEKDEEIPNYYYRENNKWSDEIIQNNILKISKGKQLKLSDFYILTNIESADREEEDDLLYINIGHDKKVLKVFINAKVIGKINIDFDLYVGFRTENNLFKEIPFEQKHAKKNYDGTTDYIMDVSKEVLNDYIYGIVWEGNDNIFINNMSVEYKEKFRYFDYKSYKKAVLNDINNIF